MWVNRKWVRLALLFVCLSMCHICSQMVYRDRGLKQTFSRIKALAKQRVNTNATGAMDPPPLPPSKNEVTTHKMRPASRVQQEGIEHALAKQPENTNATPVLDQRPQPPSQNETSAPNTRPATPVQEKGIEHALVINLNHRQDRMTAVESTLRQSGIPFTRIDAVNPRLEEYRLWTKDCFDTVKCPGQIGCQLSHIKAIEVAIQSNWSHVAIFEDDFGWKPYVDPAQVQKVLYQAMQMVPEWDVIGLSLNIQEEQIIPDLAPIRQDASRQGVQEEVRLSRVLEAQTTGAYVLSRRAMRSVLDSFRPENCPVHVDYHTAIDQCWKGLQRTGLWVAFEPQLGTQKASFSDIEQGVRDYDNELVR